MKYFLASFTGLLILLSCSNSSKECLTDGQYVFKFGKISTTIPDLEITGNKYTFFRKGSVREQGKFERLNNCRYNFITENVVPDSTISNDIRPGDKQQWKILSSNNDTLKFNFTSEQQSGQGWIVRIKKIEH